MEDLSNKNNKFLNTYSANEIIDIFSQIDEKIASLHKCSAEDFLNLNAHFKNFFKQSNIISKNASTIFESVGGNSQTNAFNNLQSFQQKLISHIDLSEKQIIYSIGNLEKIITNLELMFLPLKNFRQNLMTLKYLGVSFKLNQSFNNGANSEFESDNSKLEDLISNVTSIYPSIDESLKQLKATVKNSLFKLQKTREKSISHVDSILTQLHSTIDLLSNKNHDALKLIPKLKAKTENNSENIGKIITNLQFQDIIRQKMEHIQKTHSNMLGELLEHVSTSNGNKNLIPHDEYLVKVRDISGLQAVVLIHTNNEYQDAIEIITKKFVEIGDNVNDISNLCFEFSGLSNSDNDSFFSEIRNKLSIISTQLQNFIKINQDFGVEVDMIHIDIERIATGFENIFTIEDKLNNLLARFSDERYSQMTGIRILIETLSTDLGIIKGNLQQLFDQTLALSLGLQTSNTKFVSEIIGQTDKEITENIENIAELLVKNSGQITDLLNQNNETSEGILAEIQTAIQEIKYYDYFEKIIEEIIIELNTIYYKLKTGENPAVNKMDNLKDLENLYTMHSERAIHKHISEMEEDNVDIFKEVAKIDTKTEEDDSLELF